jgi:hypothetical protein
MLQKTVVWDLLRQVDCSSFLLRHYWFRWLGWRDWWHYRWPVFPCIRTCGDSIPVTQKEPLGDMIQRTLHVGPLLLNWYCFHLPIGQYDDYRKYDRWGRSTKVLT